MKRDPDNLRGVATKYVLDGLVKAGIIPDDSPKYIKGNVTSQFHNIILSSHHIKSYEGLCVWIDNAKVLVDHFNGYVESEGLDPDNLDSADPRLPKLYFEIDPEQARRLGEALIAHADYASTGTEDGE
tara:strand:+ start:573 stop:956 length:384 start_codon:yes stop_codon:yes gene_type:complete